MFVLHAADRASYRRAERGTTFDEREPCQEFGLKKEVWGGGGYFGLIVSAAVPEFICTYFSLQWELTSCITVRTWQFLLRRRTPDRISLRTSNFPVSLSTDVPYSVINLSLTLCDRGK
jgi:hypothetical protein